MKSILLALVILCCLACSNDSSHQQAADSVVVQTDTLPTNSSGSDSTENTGIAFAFSDEAGRQLLGLEVDSLLTPKSFTKTLSKDTTPIPISFKSVKPATENDNGRQTAQNFANSGGNLYEVSGAVNPEATTLLFTDGFLKARTLLAVQATKSKLSAADEARLKADKQRAIKSFHSLGHLSASQVFGLVEFERQQDSVLVSLVVITPEAISYKDFPAKYDETSTWRVDDGGEFDWDSYRILAAFDHRGTLEIVTEWLGAEGISIEYMVQADKQLITRKEASRYTSPL